jgi:RHS repeat-associated protein
MAVYNADDERIIFCGDGSSGPCRWTLRGNGDEVLREYESGPIGNGNSYWSYYLWVEDTVYRGSLLAGAQRETAEGGRLYFHLDHLGSPRLTTNAAGQKVTANEFAPFGRELTSITQETQLGYDRTETHRFTGHERDFVEGTASDNVNFVDYMHARTYLPVFGRFLSVDPANSANARVPQSWNAYAYAQNNPVRLTDPTGMYIWGGCETSEERCRSEQDNFEKARQNQLRSSDGTLRAAAAAYGDQGVDNGVVVSFVSQKTVGAAFNGDTTARLLIVPDHVTSRIDVRFKLSMAKDDLENATVHEGEHVRNASSYLDALKSGEWKPDLNLRLYQTEMNAYMVSWAYARTNNLTLNYNGMTLKGAMPREQLRQEIDRFLRKAPYSLTPETPRCQISPCN